MSCRSVVCCILLNWWLLLESVVCSHWTEKTCSSTSDCDNEIFTCNENKPCYVYCTGTYSCTNMTLHCPSNSDCNVECHDYACESIEIYGPYNSSNNHCGTTLNLTTTSYYNDAAFKNAIIDASNTDYVNVVSESPLSFDGASIDHSNGKRLNLVAQWVFTIINATIKGPKNGNIFITAASESYCKYYDEWNGHVLTQFYQNTINANGADNVTINCGKCGCRRMTLYGSTVNNKFHLYSSAYYGLSDSDIYCPNNGAEDDYPVENGTQICKFVSSDTSDAIVDTRVYAVEGLNDAYFGCGTGTDCMDNVRVYCSSTYNTDRGCWVVPDATYSTEVYDTITSVDWTCDNGTKYDNSSDYCENYCIDCDSWWSILLSTEIPFVKWIQNDDNIIYVLIMFFGSFIPCCCMLQCTCSHLKIDYKAIKLKRQLKKQMKKDLKARLQQGA